MKIIFLDIDGVLNCQTTKERWYGCIGMGKEKVELFNDIIKKTKAKVVLSSTWRYDKNWKETMIKNGLKCDFIGKSPRLSDKIRGEEIKKWLNNYTKIVDKYAILDDDSDFLPDQPLFKTTWQKGLTEEIANKVIKYLC